MLQTEPKLFQTGTSVLENYIPGYKPIWLGTDPALDESNESLTPEQIKNEILAGLKEKLEKLEVSKDQPNDSDELPTSEAAEAAPSK